MGPRGEGVPPSLRPLLDDVVVGSWFARSSFRVRWLAECGLLRSLGVGGAADDSEVVRVVGAALVEGPDVVHY